MPRLWSETIEEHRREVRAAILDTTAALAAEHGALAVTMSQVAERAGIGRATLYKYFPDVESILAAWHERQVAGHLQHLMDVRANAGGADRQLAAVLHAFAMISHTHHGTDLAALVHRGEHMADAWRQLRDMIRDLLVQAVAAGAVRDDVAPHVLADYCLHALAAAKRVESTAAVGQLVTVTLSAVRPPA